MHKRKWLVMLAQVVALCTLGDHICKHADCNCKSLARLAIHSHKYHVVPVTKVQAILKMLRNIVYSVLARVAVSGLCADDQRETQLLLSPYIALTLQPQSMRMQLDS